MTHVITLNATTEPMLMSAITVAKAKLTRMALTGTYMPGRTCTLFSVHIVSLVKANTHGRDPTGARYSLIAGEGEKLS